MRVIEERMVRAAKSGNTFYSANTVVCSGGDIYLHGNHIATVHPNGIVTVNLYTLRRWPTPTTKSRLRALDVDVYTKNHITYIGNRSIHDIPSDFLDVETGYNYQRA